MEPITVQLPNLSSFGPFWYLFAYFASAIFLLVFAFRNISAAGKYGRSFCEQNNKFSYPEKMNSHIARAVISGIFGVASIIVALAMSCQLFNKSVEKEYPQMYQIRTKTAT